jgi:hypothetical protein
MKVEMKLGRENKVGEGERGWRLEREPNVAFSLFPLKK